MALLFTAQPVGKTCRSQEPPPTAAEAEPGAQERREKNRRRWEGLPPEKRRALKQIQGRLAELPPEKKRELLRRLRELSPEARRRVLQRAREELNRGDPAERDARRARRDILRQRLERLPPAERERLRHLPPQELKRYFQERGRERRRQIIAGLPEPVRQKVESLSAREQSAFLRQWQAERTVERTFLVPRELEQLRQMPAARRREILAPLGPGKPPPRPEFLSEETWRRWRGLKPYERARVLRYWNSPRQP
jgi:hypothetical protein